ncbi:MAG: GNAT family N-acetyltransferase, partial [Chloroflexota bacterium]
ASLFCSVFGETDKAELYRKAAAEIRDAASKHLWREDLGRFCRMITQKGGSREVDGRCDARQQMADWWQSVVLYEKAQSGLEGLVLHVDAALLADGRIQNMAYLTEEMVSERPSIGDFLAQSFGVCLLHENEIVGWCLSEYNSGPRCEIGIATAEPFRRRGLATLMARAFIDRALAQGVYDIGWICWAGNRPSVATAEKLGFDLVDERDVYVVT